ncbi:hypothetical protein Hamer_G016253 [Homarus americanus]|uniref:Uncharacterized protein n=1 Tax=Homarus americanus TaxID=6706 RepID=A0A8J5JRQ6_HOMAM|nr:hypothetical protein Hamer_G016253 [Homarus americanus]
MFLSQPFLLGGNAVVDTCLMQSIVNSPGGHFQPKIFADRDRICEGVVLVHLYNPSVFLRSLQTWAGSPS